MTKTKKTALIIILVSIILVLSAGIVLLTDQLLVARVIEVRRDNVLVEVCNPGDYRRIGRRLGGTGEYETIRLIVKDPTQLTEGQYFVAVTRSGQEDSLPPGIGARWIFK